jgi:hypothetical protein
MRTRSQIVMTRGALAALAIGALAGCGGGAAQPSAVSGKVAGVPTTSPLAGIQDDRVYQVPAKDAESRVQTMTVSGLKAASIVVISTIISVVALPLFLLSVW